MTEIAPSLIERIAARANDSRRRTAGASLVADAQPLDLGALIADFQQHGSPAAKSMLGGAVGGMQKLMGAFGTGAVVMGPGGLGRLGGEPAQPRADAAPATEKAVAAAAERLGRPLPPELRQLYSIADGGFGPGGGLFPLEELVRRYTELTTEPFGPAGQEWPANLLPLFDYDPQWLCIDLESGRIVCWDPEELDDEESAEDWARTFIPEADSLGALMERWLAEPTAAERMEQSAREITSHVPQITIDFYAAMTSEQRARHGLEGEDWQDQLQRRFAAGCNRR